MIGIEDVIYIKNEMRKVPGGGSIIIINDTYSLYEDETVTVSVGTYSKTAIIEDGTATIKGFTETGTVTVSVSDFTKTFNIDKYSKYEVGIGGFYESWLESIDESASGYSSLADVLSDEKMVRELFTRHASVDFLVSNVGNYPEELETIINNDYCAKWINLRDYALDTLYANQLIASLMDQADKYFYGEWTIVDNTTTPPTWDPKGNVPIMTSNTAPYGKAITNGTEYSGEPIWRIFNKNATSGAVNFGINIYIGYQFNSPICVRYFEYKTLNFARVGASGILQLIASNDLTNWTVLVDNITGTHNSNYSSKVNNSDYYLYYAITLASATGNPYYYGFTNIQFYGRELKVRQSTQPTDGRIYKYINSKYYTEEWGEYDWDVDNPRHYIYDHGVELEDLILVGSASKDSDCLKLIAANDQAFKNLDTTDYTLLRGVVGSNASGTNVLLCGSGSATFTADNMPYNQSLDVSSINSTNATGVKQTATGTFDAAEIWLE